MSDTTDALTRFESVLSQYMQGNADRDSVDAAREAVRAALTQAGAGREPRELDRHGWVRPRADGAKARCGGPKICKHCQGEQLLIAAHTSPAQREPLSDAEIAALHNSASACVQFLQPATVRQIARAIERARGITTSGTKVAASAANGAQLVDGHRPGCDALGGYGNGVGACSCGTKGAA